MNRRTSLEGRWLKLADKAGGVKRLAEALGVSPSTVYRWGTGRTTRGLWIRAVRAYAKELRVPDPTASL
jgi:DNA-binding transcriptional regulator YdaS (Cro superfamily)